MIMIIGNITVKWDSLTHLEAKNSHHHGTTRPLEDPVPVGVMLEPTVLRHDFTAHCTYQEEILEYSISSPWENLSFF